MNTSRRLKAKRLEQQMRDMHTHFEQRLKNKDEEIKIIREGNAQMQRIFNAIMNEVAKKFGEPIENGFKFEIPKVKVSGEREYVVRAAYREDNGVIEYAVFKVAEDNLRTESE